MTEIRYGGPYDTEETCKVCGKKWRRHHSGSWDWEYKDCLQCRVRKEIDEAAKKTHRVE